MRDSYHDELDTIAARVEQMIGLVSDAMRDATAALLAPDLALAERVIGSDRIVDALEAELEERTFALIAQQQPVAGDLRVLISTIHLSGSLERMGDHARHVAKVARRRFPEPAIPPEAHEVIAAMSEAARSLLAKVSAAMHARDPELARSIETEDDAIDSLQRTLFALVLSPGWSHGTEAAVDLTQVGRYYERYADHAVSLARRTVFVITGVHPHALARHGG